MAFKLIFKYLFIFTNFVSKCRSLAYSALAPPPLAATGERGDGKEGEEEEGTGAGRDPADPQVGWGSHFPLVMSTVSRIQFQNDV